MGASLFAAAGPGQAAPTTRESAVAPAASAAQGDQVQAPIPALNWQRCPDLPKTYQCATAKAPLDYDNPSGPTVLLDLLKVAATKPSQKIGTLFVNPGGPGGSSRGFATMAGDILGTTVKTRYDVIGIDPRGVGPHTEMVCRTDAPVPPYSPLSFPDSIAASKVVWRQAEWARTACMKNPAAIVRHMSTADTARDMDLIRQAVGDQKLYYYGVSYGTYLGATYASMFPGRVGRLVVDGVLDPVAWATGDTLPATQPFSTRLRSAKGASEAMISAMRECDRLGKRSCVFAGGAYAKWLKLVEISKAGKLTVGGEPIPYPNLIGGILGYLYGQTYSGLDSTLQMLWDENVAKSGRVASDAAARLATSAAAIADAPYQSPQARTSIVRDAFSGVACSDTRNPENREDWWRAGVAQDKQYPWFGSLWTWASAACAKWPIVTKSDTYFGPFGGPTANPILVVGNTYDPATPIHGARKVASLFDNSRLLTYDGWGHGALGTSCVTAAFDRYYATGALPAVGAKCTMDAPLFSPNG